MFRPCTIACAAAFLSRAAVCGAVPSGFEPYQVIIDREIFGKREVPAAAPAAAGAADQKKAEQMAKRLTMCAVNRTPSGNVAVGFIDNEAKPPRNIYLNVGESADGYRIVSADYDAETATIEKEGLTITLKLGKGLVEVAAPAAPAGMAVRPSLAGPPSAARPVSARADAPAIPAAPGGVVARRLGMPRPPPAGTGVSSYREGRQARETLEQQQREAEERESRAKFEALAREVAAAEVRRQVLAEQGLTEEDLEAGEEDEDDEVEIGEL